MPEQPSLSPTYEEDSKKERHFHLRLSRIPIFGSFVRVLPHAWGYLRSLSGRVLEAVPSESTLTKTDSGSQEQAHAQIILMRDLIQQSEKLNRTVTLNEVIDTIGKGALALSKADRLSIFLRKQDGELVCAWSHNLPQDFIEAALAFSKGIPGIWDGIEHRPILIADVDRDVVDPTALKIIQVGSFRACCAWPLVYEQKASAFVCCFYNYPLAWSQDSMEILEAFFRQAAVSVENARLFEAECAQRHLAEALRDAASTLNSTLDLDEVLDGILSSLSQVVSHDAAGIMLLEGQVVRPIRWQGIPPEREEDFNRWRYSLSELRNRQIMVETLEALVIPETAQNQNWIWTSGMEWVRSYAGAPICQRGEVTGFIDVMSSAPGFYTNEVAGILQAFANQAAIALENARLYQNTHQRMSETRALYRAMAPLFNSTEDITALSSQITEAVTHEFASAHCSLLLLDDEGTGMRLIAQSGSLKLHEPDLPLDGPGLTVAAARTGRMIYSADVTQEPNYVRGSPDTRSELVIPMHVGGRMIGVLNLESPQVDAFDERGRTIMASFAERAALGLENARLFNTIRQNAEQMKHLSEIAQRRAQEADTLRLATAAVNSTLDLQSVLDSILQHLDQVVPHDSACIFLLEGEHQMRAWAVKGVARVEDVLYQSFPRDDDLLEEIERSLRPLILQDAQTDPRFHGWGGTSYVHCWMGIPLIAGKELAGILTLDRLECSEFRAEETALAQAFANQAAVAVQNARLYQAAQQHARELEALHTATTSLVSTLDLQKLLERILLAASSAVPAARAAALHLRSDDGRLVLRVQQGLSDCQIQSQEWNEASNPWRWVMRNHQPLLISSRSSPTSPLRQAALSGCWQDHALLIAPLIQEEKSLGVISLISPDQDAFDEQALHLLISFASTATAAIHNAQLHSAVQYLAITDPLTGVANRRGFFELAQKLVAQTLRFHRPLAAVMIDIDYFKLVNDRYGHDTGDLVLRTLADRCRRLLRESDLICRYGGEEFIILLADSDASGALAAAQRLFHSISQIPIETPAGPVQITVSMGIASFSEQCSTLDDLLKLADLALYQAKAGGRSRVYAWNGHQQGAGSDTEG